MIKVPSICKRRGEKSGISTTLIATLSDCEKLTSNKTDSTSISMMWSSSLDMSNPGVEGRVTTGLSEGVGMADICTR